ncbi:MAG: transcription termination factor NusA [Polyangiaceae bacterium]|nr:transcription termination factor NusA [Polyangiaceae bacterium]
MAASPRASGSDPSLGLVIEQVAKEKGIEKQVLIESIEASIHKAAQSAFGMARELEARFNAETGQVDLYQYMTIVDVVNEPERELSVADAKRYNLTAEVGEELGFQVFWRPEDSERASRQDEQFGDLLKLKQARGTFGRIAAQAAKQVLLQRVRDAERDIIYGEYKDRKGELIRGIVRRFEKGSSIIVDLGRTEGVLPHREQTPRETYRPGDRIVAYVRDIDPQAKGAQIILSRSDPKLVEKLFESEVPEIYEGIVRIVGVAREAGSRSKIAVTSRDADVDPVGACVGMKGSRVQAVVQELRGEKIDIVLYDRDAARYVIAAIQPADVTKVIVDEADGRMELVVPDEKLSLAIGKKGQNVRLAAALTKWRLDIISEAKFKQIEEEAMVALQQIDDVSDSVAKSMYRLGFRSLEEVAEAGVDELGAIPGLGGQDVAARIKQCAEDTMEKLRQERIRAASHRTEPLSNKDRLMFIPGVGTRSVLLLDEAGYKSVEDILREDTDRLAIRTGLGIKKARTIKQGAQFFVESEQKVLDAARQETKRKIANSTATSVGNSPTPGSTTSTSSAASIDNHDACMSDADPGSSADLDSDVDAHPSGAQSGKIAEEH